MILIVGCGFLGSNVLQCALSKTKEPILATVRNMENAPKIDGAEYFQCDVTKEADLLRLADRCSNESLTVFYFAACHYIDYVFENPQQARQVNVDALERFISLMPNIKKLFFASTDCVYGESGSRVLKESAPLNPVNEYGRQKISAEEIIRGRGFTVLRLPFMLGHSLLDKPHFYDNVRAELSKGKCVEMIDGMGRSVLSYSQVAEIIYSLSLHESLPQVINVCGDNVLSKYDVGCILAEKSGAPKDLIIKISEEEGQKFFKDKRASCTAMDNSLLKKILGVSELKWEEEQC